MDEVAWAVEFDQVAAQGVGEGPVAEPDAVQGEGVGADDEVDLEPRLLPGEPGPPVLAGAVAWFGCPVRDVVPIGDHACFVGEVVGCGRDPDAAPRRASRGWPHRLGRPAAPARWTSPAAGDLAAAR